MPPPRRHRRPSSCLNGRLWGTDEARAGGGDGTVARVSADPLEHRGVAGATPAEPTPRPLLQRNKAFGPVYTPLTQVARRGHAPRRWVPPTRPPHPSLWPGPPATPIEGVASGGAPRGTGHFVSCASATVGPTTRRAYPFPPPLFPPSMAPPLCPHAQQRQAPPPPPRAWAAAEGGRVGRRAGKRQRCLAASAGRR